MHFVPSGRFNPFNVYDMAMQISQQQFQWMVEKITADLIECLVVDENYDISKAIDVVYGSDTYRALARPVTGLYNQSTGYVREYLLRELRMGKLQ